MAKVLLFIADGTEEVEALTTVDILRRAGIEVTTVSIMGREEIKSSHGIRIHADALIEDVVFDDKDMLILPGGKVGTDNLKANKILADQILKFRSEKKALAAICAAPSILIHKGLVEDGKFVCFPGFENGLTPAQGKSFVNGKIITGKGVGAAFEFSYEIIRLLEGEEKARETLARTQF